MKVLYVYSGKAKKSGLDLVVRQELQALAEAGHQIDFLARGGFAHPAVNNITLPITPAHLISFLSSKHYYNAQNRFFSQMGAWLLRLRRYDAVVSWTRQSRNLFRAANRRKVFSVINAPGWHFNYPLGEGVWEERPWPSYKQHDLQEEFERADLILATSDFATRTFTANNFAPAKLATIFRGADLSHYAVDPARPGTPFRAVFLGRVSERKGIQTILDGWQQANLADAELWIVGSVPKELKSLTGGTPPSVRFLGHQDDPAPLLRQCHVQILASRKEGMAKSLIEGAACGLATLATAETGFPMRDGETGYAFGVGDAGQLAQHLRELHADPEKTRAMGLAGAEFVHRQLSWPQFRQRLVDELETRIASHRQDDRGQDGHG